MSGERIEINDRFWSPEQVAEALACSVHTVRRWCREGYLDSVHVGRLVRIPDEGLQALLRRVRAAADQVRAGGEPDRALVDALSDPVESEVPAD